MYEKKLVEKPLKNCHSKTEDMMDNIRTDLREMRFEDRSEMELL
jgi:hypothetical protein